MKMEGATTWSCARTKMEDSSFVCRGEKVLLRGKGTFRGMEDPCHQTEEHWSCPYA